MVEQAEGPWGLLFKPEVSKKKTTRRTDNSRLRSRTSPLEKVYDWADTELENWTQFSVPAFVTV